jgi:hypothetical protein
MPSSSSVGSGMQGPAPLPPTSPQLDETLETIRYRFVAKSDFRGRSSRSLWGNVAHGGEICTAIVRIDELDRVSFAAVMQPDCSFWNKVIGPTGKAIRVAGALAGVPTIAPDKQPDWYILQHEQLHFAINEAAALHLTRQFERLPHSRQQALAEGMLQMLREKIGRRHAEFDADTSGKFDPDSLEKWVSVLEVQMREFCGEGPDCQVRTPD